MVTEEHAERIRQGHENAYDSEKAEAGSDRTVTYLARTLVISPQVMPITPVSPPRRGRPGRMPIFFGTSGDLACLRHLADREGFRTEVIAQEGLAKDGWRVDYFTFRLTQDSVRP